MHSIMKNVAHLCSRKRSKVWGTEGWKKIVVCIIADGRKSCNSRVLDVLSTMGVYQKGIAKNIVNNKPVQAHLFEVIYIYIYIFKILSFFYPHSFFFLFALLFSFILFFYTHFFYLYAFFLFINSFFSFIRFLFLFLFFLLTFFLFIYFL